jgi:hypothetical protein
VLYHIWLGVFYLTHLSWVSVFDTLTWLMEYIYYWHFQYLSNVNKVSLSGYSRVWRYQREVIRIHNSKDKQHNVQKKKGESRAGSRGEAHPARASLKLEKIWFFGVKSWFFTRNTPTIFAPPSARRDFFKCAPPNLKSWIRPWKGQTTIYKTPHRKLLIEQHESH